MKKFTEEKNVLILMSLMKEHGVRKVIVSPGTTNVSLVLSLQQDNYFELYSAYDERSAAYMACGMAAESGEPVALSCTQATASRNYFSGLTEAYYRKLPILAITSTQHAGRIGQGFQQAIDRTVQPKDTVHLSLQVPVVNSTEDWWHCNTMINNALLELRRYGGRPVHLNLFTTYSRIFNQHELPRERVIKRINYFDLLNGNFPLLNQNKKIAIFVGAHKKWSNKLIELVNSFCEKYNAVVCCDQISNYNGPYRVNVNLIGCQIEYQSPALTADVIIHIGEITGGSMRIKSTDVWRIDPNGEIMDTFKNQKLIFEMEEEYFFQFYLNIANKKVNNFDYLNLWKNEILKIESNVSNLPFSNAWIAKQTLKRLPENTKLHMGIYNSYRMWSMFSCENVILGNCNTGGFGIDGCISSMIGASLCTDSLVYGVFGDLAFFYDMNSLANKHVRDNLRIMLINNGIGTEFKNPDNRAFKFGNLANTYVAAEGHNGNKSKDLIKHYSEDLGYMYIKAENKEEYLSQLDVFLDETIKQSIIFEVFTDYKDETKAYDILMHSYSDLTGILKTKAKNVLGDSGIAKIKELIKK